MMRDGEVELNQVIVERRHSSRWRAAKAADGLAAPVNMYLS